MSGPRIIDPAANQVPEGARAIKRAAIQLFAERGIDGVTVRDIAQAASQKTMAPSVTISAPKRRWSANWLPTVPA